MSGKDPSITVDGRWLALDTGYGNVEFSTVWPGGMDQLTFTPDPLTARRFSGGQDARVYLADSPVPIGAGTLTEPDPSQGQMVAVGAWQDAANWPALTAAGAATKNINTAVDAAIGNGLNWTRNYSFANPTAADVDTTQGPVNLGELLDAWSNQSGLQWGVDPQRLVYAKNPGTEPTWQMFPQPGGLGFDLTNYASQLVGRYYNGSTYATAASPVNNSHGTKVVTVDLTSRGTLTSAKAITILTNLLAFGRATPGWTQPIGLSYGEILNMGGNPVDLATVHARGNLLRIHGGWELAQRLNGQMYVDIPLGHTSLAGGVLTIQPAQLAVRNLADYIAKKPK